MGANNVTTELQNEDVDTVASKRVLYGREVVKTWSWGERCPWRDVQKSGATYNVVADGSTFPQVLSDGRAWVSETLERLGKIEALPENWDGEGSPATDVAVVVAVAVKAAVHRGRLGVNRYCQRTQLQDKHKCNPK